jgi:hypothetical protein
MANDLALLLEVCGVWRRSKPGCDLKSTSGQPTTAAGSPMVGFRVSNAAWRRLCCRHSARTMGKAPDPTLNNPPSKAHRSWGFLLASGANGPLTPVDVPGAPRTAPAALNDRGQIVGLYENPNAQPAGPTDQ